jgi:membrane associated rhomboid family serine protease
MIPLRSTERVRSTAIVTLILILINTVVFLYEQILPSWALDSFIAHYGIIPDRLRMSSLLTSMFLHGGWLHLIGNMWFLWVFGRNVEDLIGSGRFLLFYILCGLAAGLVQVFFNPYSRVPTVGASGAIAGVMGAYVIKFPRARITTLVPIFVFITTLEIPAVFLLLYWFAIQFFSGVGSIGYSQVSSGGVAWFAHVGGFLAGMLLVSLFGEKQRWTARWDQW